MRWLFLEATTSFSLLHIIKNPMWHCMGRPMGLLMCTNVLALISQKEGAGWAEGLQQPTLP
jgi:hypothetical protein